MRAVSQVYQPWSSDGITNILARCSFHFPWATGAQNNGLETVRLLRIIETVKADFGKRYLAWLKVVFDLQSQKRVGKET